MLGAPLGPHNPIVFFLIRWLFISTAAKLTLGRRKVRQKMINSVLINSRAFEINLYHCETLKAQLLFRSVSINESE